MIYLDNAATTYPKPECVYLALDKANRNAFNTGRGSYKVAREASNVKENVRKKIMQLNNIKNANVVYTNSATTALNDIIFGIELNRGDYVYVVSNNIVQKTYVTLGREFGQNREVTGIREGTQVAVAGVHNLRDGMRVKIQTID